MRKNVLKTVATLALGATVAVCGLALVGCDEDKPADKPAQTQEQDNCYGDDLPAINTTGSDQQDNCYGDDLPAINTNA